MRVCKGKQELRVTVEGSAGRLVPSFDGYFICYPSKPRTSAAFKVAVNGLRHRR